jgi:glyoxylase-like metal-dependent hydrolase (beta-lactamase superfamily II)
MAVAAEPKPLAHPLAGGREGATVKLRPLLGGEILGPPEFFAGTPRRLGTIRTFLSSRKNWIWAPIPAFLIEHPTAGLVLVDTAMHPSVEVDPKANLGQIGSMANTCRAIDGGIPQRLRDLGREPTDIGTVVMTHLHYDHASGLVEFPQATFVVDRREWVAASEGSRPGLRGYHHAHFDHAFDWRAVDYDDEWVSSLSPFGKTVDLFGDGSIRLVSTPGHTLGHQSIVLRLRGRDALLTADAAYLQRTIDEDEGVDPLLMQDEHLYRRSLKEIKRFVEREPEALVITGHDPETWPKLDALYE